MEDAEAKTLVGKTVFTVNAIGEISKITITRTEPYRNSMRFAGQSYAVSNTEARISQLGANPNGCVMTYEEALNWAVSELENARKFAYSEYCKSKAELQKINMMLTTYALERERR